MYISSTKKCNDRIYETRTWYEKGSAPPGTPGSHLIELITCVSKGSATAIIRARSACNSKTQRTALWQRPLGPPGSPSIKSVEMGILGSAILKIGAPEEDGGARVISYLVRSSPGDITATFTPDRIKAAKITGLTPGNSYTFKVVAINSKGASLSSSASSPELAPTVPSIPRISKVVATGANSAQLTFIAPTNNGGSPVISYTATSTPGGLQTTVYQSSGGTINISNLAHSTPYTFTLTAKNAAGSSQTSPISTSITTAAPPPSPESISVAPSAPRDTTISAPAIAGVTAPVTGATPVTTTTAGTGYTGTVSWSGSPGTFASTTIYTATITLTPTSGYTLTGVSANFFTVTDASSVTHSANSGVITAVFPATVLTAPAFTLSSSSETRTVNTAATGFTILSTGGAIESFSISATPAGMSFDTTTGAFSGTPTSVASATNYTITATNAAGSTAQTFTFTVRDLIPISVEPIAGVTAPVTGATPVTTTTAGTGYTGTVSWSGSPATFASATSYTATITLTPTSGYTLTGVSANFFTVAGASSVTHSANSGAITAIFPATAKATQTISFTDPADITYGQSPSSLSATSTSTLTVTFSTATSGVCTVSGTTLTILTAGICTINANQAGDANYESASQVIQSFAIAKATPSLSNFANLSKTVGEASFDLTAPTVANSLPGSFSYVSATTATATISGATLTLGAAGTSLITATFTPTDTTNYNNATITMTLTLSVAAPAFTLSSSSESRTVNTAATGFTINSTGGAIASFVISATPAGMSFNTSTGAFTGTPTTVAGATTYTVTATNATGSTTQTFTFTVSRATQATLSITSLTTNIKAYPYSQALSITTSGGSGTGAMTFAIASGGTASGCTLSDSTATATLTATTVGTCLIQASKAADATYNAVTSASASFTFTTATQTITFATPANMTVGGFTQTVAPSASSSLTVTLASITADVCTVASFVITAVTPGTCSITASQAGNANYEAASDVIRTFAITGVINIAAIAGVTAPATGATPVSTTTAGTGYTGTVSWASSGGALSGNFAGGTSYTATITLTPSSGYTLTGVTANFFTVAGASSVTNSADSGVITAVLPATLAAPAFTLSSSSESRTVNTVATGFTINSTGGDIASFAISPAAPAGMSFNTSTGALSGTPSTVAGATTYTITATNATGSTTQTFTFTVTGLVAISVASIAGVTAPVTGATPVSTTTVGTGYTGTVSWSGSPSTFAGATGYTATITLTPTSGYTLTGVSANFFTVAGASPVTNSADSGVITAVFPATASSSKEFETFSGATAITSTGETTGTVSAEVPYGTNVTAFIATFRHSGVSIAVGSIAQVSSTTANNFTSPVLYVITAADGSTKTWTVTLTVAPPITISAPAIAGVRVPEAGETPASTTTAGTGYTGVVSWASSGGALSGNFAGSTSYTATITLTASSGYTLTGVRANFFTVAGASSVTNSADSGVITAVFPATATTISVAAIVGVTAPVTGATPVSTTTSGTGYTGTVSWYGSPATFAAVTSYSATIILTPTSGYTFIGVSENFFTVAGATIVTNSINSGVITAIFPETASGPAAKVAITTAAVGTQRRIAFFTQPKITVQDSSGNTVTSSSAVVTATVSSGATLVGTTTATASSGVATFTNLGVDGTIGTTYTITYTADGLTAATATVTLAGTTCDGTSFTCKLGDTGPGGGFIYYYSDTGFNCGANYTSTGSPTGGLCHYLEVAPYGWNTGSDPLLIWGNTGADVPTITNDTSAYNNAAGIGLGRKNSIAIISQYGVSSHNYAAWVASAYSGGALSDWYLPSTAELNLLCKWNRGDPSVLITTVCGGGRINSPTYGANSAGFVEASFYWSSSEYGLGAAWTQSFFNGTQYVDSFTSSTSHSVRPVRAF